ncbi:hypothetical protein CK227_10555 [Mesorhizobium sp. WSM4308]|uniref:helix-turn-helix domain-containing protein n=1 Tax=Mesorhizobium sp. WSM4308 TaxID=2029409 RepID=UPI000BB0C6D4|nr:helix-turn-helix transcriptional regulator [Mesorhizobium sp. WSM4308]PBB75224.1 hypothetical protein CK227_10555 [Mesorhizobium sp. WSM4308]
MADALATTPVIVTAHAPILPVAAKRNSSAVWVNASIAMPIKASIAAYPPVLKGETMRLGELIGIAREIKGWTLRDLEKASGVSNALISQIETGKVRDPGFTTVVRLMDALRLSLDRAAQAEREKLKVLRKAGVWKPEVPEAAICEHCNGTCGHHGIMGGPDSPACGHCGGTGRAAGAIQFGATASSISETSQSAPSPNPVP